MMPVSQTMHPSAATVITAMAPPRMMRVLPLIGHCSPPVWLGVMKGARPRRSGPPPRARDVGDAAPGMLALGRQVWETQGRDDLLADVQVEVLHVVDHHLG